MQGVQNDANQAEEAATAGEGGGLSEVRLYVGGLGPAVIPSDLFQTFSTLARVSSVEVVRTKGRSFAYVTIHAAPHDLKRLFSLYNGCTWKGGCLKLEKAREFYMNKLRREWAERDDPEDLKILKSDSGTPSKITSNSKESSGLKIYFPKLRKVKKIPEKGLGKHKRSFERVEPLPHSLLRICNCDQDCIATCSCQCSTETESLHMAKKEGRQENSTSQSSKHAAKDKRNFKGGKVLNGKLRAGNERQVEVPDPEDIFLNIKGGISTAEHDDEEDITDFDEQILNVTGLSQDETKSFESQDETKSLMDWELHKGETKVKMEGAFHKQRKRQKVYPDASPRKEQRHHSESEEVTDQLQQESGLAGSKVPRISEGRSWLQKASWKSLGGGTRQFSFSLGNIVDQYNHSTQK